MSLFCGLLNKGEHPQTEIMGKMVSKLKTFHHLSEKQWNNRKVQFCLLKRISTPESEFENLPFTENQCTIIACSRIDNREHLGSLLELEAVLVRSLSDSELILKSYLKWGVHCTEKFSGDWAFAIWDERNQKLFLAVDHLSGHGIYYYSNASFFAFANNKNAILASKADREKLNDIYVLKILLISFNQNPETSHQDIFYIPPGSYMIIDSQGKMVKKRYWFPSRIPGVKYKKEQEYIESFYDLYKQAVRSTLRGAGKTGSHLSGGLDSGSTAWLAAQCLKEEGRVLTAFTGTSLYETKVFETKFDNEAYFAALTAESSGNIDHQIFTCPGISIIDSIQFAAKNLAELYHGIGNLYWLFEISRYARDEGFNVVLNSQIGNVSVSWKGATLKSRIKRSVLDAGRNFNNTVLRRNRSLDSLKKIPYALADPFMISLLSKEYLSSFTIEDLIRKIPDELDSEKCLRISDQRMKLLNPGACSKGLFWQNLGQLYGLHYWDPTRDKPLLEFCLGLPENMYYGNPGRKLIRRAMEERLPDEVIHNSRTGLQASDIAIRLSKETRQMDAILEQLYSSEFLMNILNFEAIHSAIRELKSHPENYFSESFNLTRIFGLIFLHSQS